MTNKEITSVLDARRRLSNDQHIIQTLLLPYNSCYMPDTILPFAEEAVGRESRKECGL